METLKPINTTQEKPKRKSGCMKYFLTMFLILLLIGAGYFYWKFYYPYTSDGVKSGYLNFAVEKGQIFKTYEGKLIQEGIRGGTGGTVQSNEFEFSIKNKEVFEVLKMNSGKRFELHYKEFNGVLPWRGNTRYIVDSIISMTEALPTYGPGLQQQTVPVQPAAPQQQMQPPAQLPTPQPQQVPATPEQVPATPQQQ